MSKYDDQDDDDCAVCPYCRSKHCIEPQSQSESGTVLECDYCDKKFEYVTNIPISHSTSPNCSLNNSDHVGWPCNICGSYERD